MFNWVDITIAIIIVYNLFRGFTKGFIRSIAGLVGYLVSIIVSKIYYKSVSIYLVSEYTWFGNLKTSISNHIKSSFTLNSPVNNYGADAIDSSVINNMNLPPSIRGDVVKFFSEFGSMKTGGNAVDSFADYFSDFVLSGMAFLLIFFACLIAIKLLTIFLDSFVKLPILKQVNQLSGIIFGAIKGCLIVYLIMTIVIFTTPIISNTVILDSIRSSTLGSFFYNYNIFLFVIDNIIAGDFKNLMF